MTLSLKGCRSVACTLTLVLLVSLVPAPLGAAERPATRPSAPAPTTLAAAANATVAALEPAKLSASVEPAEPAQQPAPTTTGNGSFFKSPKGVITIVLFAAGTAYAIHATQNDRVNSPIR